MNQLQQGVTHRTNFINGQWVDSEQCIEVENPATGELIGLGTFAGTWQYKLNQDL